MRRGDDIRAQAVSRRPRRRDLPGQVYNHISGDSGSEAANRPRAVDRGVYRPGWIEQKRRGVEIVFLRIVKGPGLRRKLLRLKTIRNREGDVLTPYHLLRLLFRIHGDSNHFRGNLFQRFPVRLKISQLLMAGGSPRSAIDHQHGVSFFPGGLVRKNLRGAIGKLQRDFREAVSGIETPGLDLCHVRSFRAYVA